MRGGRWGRSWTENRHEDQKDTTCLSDAIDDATKKTNGEKQVVFILLVTCDK